MKEHWLDDASNMRRLWRGFLAVLVSLVALEFGVGLHPHFAIDAIFGFHAWYGLLACAAMIAVAKALGFVLKRPENHYERDDGHA